MRIAGDGRHALKAEIEELGFETCFLEKGNEEGAEAAVYVERDLALDCQLRESGDVIDDAVREVGCGAD